MTLTAAVVRVNGGERTQTRPVSPELSLLQDIHQRLKGDPRKHETVGEEQELLLFGAFYKDWPPLQQH